MEKIASWWREDCPHRKIPPCNCVIHSPMPPPPPPQPGERLYSSPLACVDHDLHSFYFVCLRELEKKSAKIKQKQNFSGSHLTFFFGGGVAIVSNTHNFVYR